MLTPLLAFAAVVTFYLFAAGLTRVMTPRLFRQHVRYRGFAAVSAFALVVFVI